MKPRAPNQFRGFVTVLAAFMSGIIYEIRQASSRANRIDKIIGRIALDDDEAERSQ
jgi:hypothetical protein